MTGSSQKQDVFLSNEQADRADLLAKHTGSDNGVLRKPTRFGLTEEGDVTRTCKGCSRRFIPTGPQCYCSHECYSETLRGPIEPRFWAKVNKSGPPPAHVPHLGNCWLWTASVLAFGHGQFTYRQDGRQQHINAHRYSWELAHGPIPKGLSCLHKCDTPSCVRSDHLFLGTQADNLADARQKGRLVDGLAARKLSDEAYEDILGSTMSGLELAAKYGVHEVTISRIRRGHQGATFHQSKAFRARPSRKVAS
jgi:HNH endonuclease